MGTKDTADDVGAIKALIDRQFGSLDWTPGTSADWRTFEADFFPGATLYPAARPARVQTIAAFIERMQKLSQTTLLSFNERVLGTHIRVFGNVAVAAAACEMVENGVQRSRGVEMILLVKDQGTWRIVAQAWDAAGEGKPIPSDLLDGGNA